MPIGSLPPTDEAAALGALRKSVQQKQEAVAALLADVAKQQSVRELNVQLTQTHTASLRVLDQQLASLGTAALAPDHPLQHPAARVILALPSGEQVSAITAQLTQLDLARTALDASVKAHLQAVKTFDAARARHEADQTAFTQAERSLGQLTNRLATASADRDAAQRTAEAAAQELSTRLAELEPLFIGLPAARADFEADVADLLARFVENVETLKKLDRHLDEAARWSESAEVELAGFITAATTAAAALAKRQAEEAEARRAHDGVRAERDRSLGGRPVATVVAELKQATEQAEAAFVTATSALAETEKAVATATESERSTQVARLATHARHQTTEAGLASWLATFTGRTGRELTSATLENWLGRDEAWFKTERAALDSLQSEVKTAEGALKVHRTSQEAHVATCPTPDDEVTVTADLAERKTAKAAAAQLYVTTTATLTADDQRRADCAALLDQLNAQKAKAEPWGQLNELIGSADGAKFRAIAQRRTLDLLLGFANAQLDLLSSRYRLERLPESLSLIVCDRDMADERRSVHSLSGGESFLVSLALALGLASLTSNRLRIESLFIDEGFGSLDPATLATAMNALMQLEAQGRKVGVISHVTEMADAIPVQIKIEKGRAGASRLVVPGADPLLAYVEPSAEAQSDKPRPAAVRNAVKAPALVLAPEAQAERAQGLLSRLRETGGKSGNQSLREALGWDEGT